MLYPLCLVLGPQKKWARAEAEGDGDKAVRA